MLLDTFGSSTRKSAAGAISDRPREDLALVPTLLVLAGVLVILVFVGAVLEIAL